MDSWTVGYLANAGAMLWWLSLLDHSIVAVRFTSKCYPETQLQYDETCLDSAVLGTINQCFSGLTHVGSLEEVIVTPVCGSAQQITWKMKKTGLKVALKDNGAKS